MYVKLDTYNFTFYMRFNIYNFQEVDIFYKWIVLQKYV